MCSSLVFNVHLFKQGFESTQYTCSGTVFESMYIYSSTVFSKYICSSTVFVRTFIQVQFLKVHLYESSFWKFICTSPVFESAVFESTVLKVICSSTAFWKVHLFKCSFCKYLCSSTLFERYICSSTVFERTFVPVQLFAWFWVVDWSGWMHSRGVSWPPLSAPAPRGAWSAPCSAPPATPWCPSPCPPAALSPPADTRRSCCSCHHLEMHNVTTIFTHIQCSMYIQEVFLLTEIDSLALKRFTVILNEKTALKHGLEPVAT